MALDFYSLTDNQFLFSLEEKEYDFLSGIFEAYYQQTGLLIDQYADTRLPSENQRLLIKLIDRYAAKANLNGDRDKTVAILAFRGLLVFFSGGNHDLKIKGD